MTSEIDAPEAQDTRPAILDLPFWLSPWRKAFENGTLYHKIDVARSRKDSKRQKITISVPDEALRDVSEADRRKMFSGRLVEALQTLGICRTDSTVDASAK